MRHPRPQRSRRWLAAAWLLPTAAAAVLLQMPAQALAGLLAAACHQHCRLADAAGPWWAGHGQLFARPAGDAAWLPLGPLAWHLLPGGDELLAVTLGSGRAALDRHLELRIDRLQLPASLVLAHPVWQLPATGWQGSLELARTTIGRDGRRPGASRGQLIWRGAASGLLENHPLGDLQANWEWHPAHGLRAELGGGRAGAVALSGQLQAAADGGAQLTAEVGLDGESQLALDRYLRVVGVPLADRPGHYALAWPVR